MAKFKIGDIIKVNGEHFAEREIVDIVKDKYVTKFLEDYSMAETSIKIIDANYWLK